MMLSAATTTVLSLFLLLPLVVASSTSTIHVRNGSQLVDTLCGDQQLEEDTVIILNHLVPYDINSTVPGRTCVVKVSNSLTITTNTTTTTDMASITCVDQNTTNPFPTIGFLFTDSNITISNVLITGCGASVDKCPHTVELTNCNSCAALFTFLNCSITITRVDILSYYGYALVTSDSPTAVLTELSIKYNLGIALSSVNSNYSVGSGLLVIFTKSVQNDSIPSVKILNSVFYGNFYYNLGGNAPIKNDGDNIIPAAALTIVFNKNVGRPQVIIAKTCFSKNLGTHSGGVLIHMTSSNGGLVDINDSTFKATIMHPQKNISSSVGPALSIYTKKVRDSLIRVTDTSFTIDHYIETAETDVTFLSYGAIYSNMHKGTTNVKLHLKSVQFKTNATVSSGTCLTVVADSSVHAKTDVMVILESLTANKNSECLWNSLTSDKGLFLFVNIDKVIINGSSDLPSSFSFNARSVIQAEHSFVALRGHIRFRGNRARYGTAFYMKDSRLHFQDDLVLEMVNNKAMYLGGAIYIENLIYEELPKCAMQFDTSNLTITSSNNIAELGGNIVYAYPIYNCYIGNHLVKNTTYYTDKFGSETSNHSLPISTFPRTFQICHANSKLTTYAGQTKHIRIRAVDEANNTVWSQVHISVGQHLGQSNALMTKIVNSERMQCTSECTNNSCSTIKITVSSTSDYDEEKRPSLVLSQPISSIISVLKLSLLKCPPGFTMQDGTCQCSRAIQRFYNNSGFQGNCDIDMLTITKPLVKNPWIGNTTMHGNFAIAENCPFMFCNLFMMSSAFKYNPTMKDYTVDGLNICQKNRRGILCSECVDNHSVILGSEVCERCSNWWLLMIPIYIISGPLLICVLYVLKLTLTSGTINGFIFFSQISNLGLVQSLMVYNQQKGFLATFVLMLSLDTIVPHCLFDGMTEIYKVILSLVLSIYFIASVGIVIILSKRSSWLSERVSQNSVQVLITVVHLSVSRLLKVAVDISISVKVYTENNETSYLVWNRNGNIPYLTGSHAIVFCITVFVVSLVLIPYLAILLFGKQFLRCSPSCNIYIRPILEAVHAPYKEKHQYWFVGRLLFVITLSVAYGCETKYIDSVLEMQYYFAHILWFLLVIQAFIRPLKSRLQNIVDFLIVLSAVVAYYISCYIYMTDTDKTINYGLFYGSIYTVLALFIATLAYHIALATGQVKRLQEKGAKIKNLFLALKRSGSSEEEQRSLNNVSVSFYSSYSHRQRLTNLSIQQQPEQ